MGGALEVEPNRVIMRGDWATEVIYGVTYSGTENIETFNEQFSIESGKRLADPNEDFYQGVMFMALIRRKSDNRLFGYPYWWRLGKYEENEDEEPNGEEHGLDEDAYVWLPVEPFTVTGYTIPDQQVEELRED